MEPSIEIVHAIPGRIRLRVPALITDPELAERILAVGMTHPGVRQIRINLACASVVIEGDPRGSAVTLVGHWLTATPPESAPPRDAPPPRKHGSLTQLAFSLAGIAVSFLGGGGLGVAVALTVVGALPIVRRAMTSFVAERRLTVDHLDSVAVALMASLGDVRGAALMCALVALGEEIRERTARRSQLAAFDLKAALGQAAWLVRGAEKVRVPVGMLKINDTVAVYPGDLIPIDGVVVEGSATVDQQMLTGESAPILKNRGDSVFAGTMLLDGKLHARAERVGAATRAGSIIKLLEQAPTLESKSARYADRFAGRLVAPTFALATVALATTGSPARAAAILIVDFATGIRISAPTSIMATMARAARDGVLIKGGGALERLASADAIVFDKTGTLTRGRPDVFDVVSVDARYSVDVVLALAASAEMRLNHPAAQAVVRHAQRRRVTIPPRRDLRYTPGLGVLANVEGRGIRVGSARFMREAGLAVDDLNGVAGQFGQTGASLAYVAIDGALAGLVAYRDPVRTESENVIAQLRARGIVNLLIVTGDESVTAQAVARELGIDRVEAGMLPDEKVAIVQELQRSGHKVAVVGDGINDSPALAHADVSISLSHGSDVARETADVVLMDSDLNGLVRAIDLARQCVELIRQNIVVVGVPNAAALALATVGGITPVGSTLLNNGSTVVAALNGLRPLMRSNGHNGHNGPALLPAPEVVYSEEVG